MSNRFFFMGDLVPQRISLAGERLARVRLRQLLNAPAAMKVGIAFTLCIPGGAMAQTSSVIDSMVVSPSTFNTLVAPAIAPDYYRDHNIGVLEQWHEDYEAPGAAIGSFILHPQATLGTLADSNVYATEATKKADVAGVLQLGAALTSDWSRHQIGLRIDTDQRRYATQTRRNQNSWSLQPTGKIELGKRVVLSAEGRFGRYFQAPFSNDLSPDAQILSNFFSAGILLKGIYTSGRVRVTGAYDHSAYDFATLYFPDGTSVSQTSRNRKIDRFSGQAEYALSPSVAVYVGGAADTNHYDVAPVNGSILTSSGANVLAGVSFDLAGVMRGIIGAGYSARRYTEAKQYNSGGASFQARLDFFPWEMTTVSVSAQRLVLDSGLATAPLADTRLSFEVDQSLRENLVVVVNAAIANQSYFNTDGARNSRQLQTSVRYQASRWLGFRGEVSYRYSRPTIAELGTTYEGLLFGLSVTARR